MEEVEEKAKELIAVFDKIVPQTTYVADGRYRDEGIKKMAYACVEQILIAKYPHVEKAEYDFWYAVQAYIEKS